MAALVIPRFISESVILSKEEIAQLASLAAMPTDEEVDAIRGLADIQELWNAFIGDETTRTTHLQLKAKGYLAAGQVSMAWKVLLL